MTNSQGQMTKDTLLLKYLLDRHDRGALRVEIQLVALDQLVFFENLFRRRRSIANRRRLAGDGAVAEVFGVLRDDDDLDAVGLQVLLDGAIDLRQRQLRQLPAHIVS